MAGDFGGTSHRHESATPVVFEVGVYPFHGRAFLESRLFMLGECARVGTAEGIGIDNGHMAKGAGKLMNLRSVICGIAEIVKAVLDLVLLDWAGSAGGSFFATDSLAEMAAASMLIWPMMRSAK